MKSGDGETALAEVFTARGLSWMTIFIYFAALLGITAATMTNMMSQSRILFAYSKDGLFFKVFQDLDPKTKVPVKGSWLAFIPVSLFAFFMNLRTLA